MKKYILSILVSLLFIPLAIIGQAIGLFFGGYAAKIFANWFAASFIVLLIPYLLSGVLGGYISAKAIQFLYKSFHLTSTLIIPSILIFISCLGEILGPIYNKDSNFDFLIVISNLALIISYYYFLKEIDNNNN